MSMSMPVPGMPCDAAEVAGLNSWESGECSATDELISEGISWQSVD